MSKGPRDRNYSESLSTGQSTFRRRLNPPGDWVLYTSGGSSVYAGGRLSVANPWRERKPADVNSSPTSRTLTRASGRTDPRGEIRWTTSGYDYLKYGPPHPGLYARLANEKGGDSQLNTLRDLAIVDALTKLKDQKFNAGVAIAEASGIARMVVDAGDLIITTRRLLRKGEFEKAYERFRGKTNYGSYPWWRRKYWDQIKHVKSVQRSQLIPQGWLYYHFGLLPTLSDIEGAHHEWIRKNTDPATNPALFRQKVQGYSKHVVKVPVSYESATGRAGFDGKVERLESVRVFLTVTPKSATLARLSTLGATNLPEAVWNGTPFSWVVDYFVNIGDFLHVLDAGLGWAISDTWITASRVVRKVSGRYVAGNHLSMVSASEPVYNEKNIVRNIERGLYGPIGQITPHVKLRGPSAKQIANMLSVLATMFKGVVRP